MLKPSTARTRHVPHAAQSGSGKRGNARGRAADRWGSEISGRREGKASAGAEEWRTFLLQQRPACCNRARGHGAEACPRGGLHGGVGWHARCTHAFGLTAGAILPAERAGANRTLARTLPERRGGTHGAHSTHIGTHSSTHVLRKQAPSFWKLCWGLPRSTALALSLVSVVGCDQRRYTLSARLEQHAACDVAHHNAACMRAALPRAARCARPARR
jgi:hypothetical protein